MASLTIKHREETVAAILKASFEPRFAALERDALTELREFVEREHPGFVVLEGSPYRAYMQCSSFYTSDEKHFAFSKYVSGLMPPNKDYYCDQSKWRKVKSDVGHATSVHEFFVSGAITARFTTVWSEYIVAHDKLRELLYSYNIREKFIADFPEFEVYLPAIATRSKLPMVIVGSVRASLSELGIPA